MCDIGEVNLHLLNFLLMKKTIQLLSALSFVMLLSAGISYAQCNKPCTKAQASTTSEATVQKVAQQSTAAKATTSCCPHAKKAASANCNPAACTGAKTKMAATEAPKPVQQVQQTRGTTPVLKTAAVSEAKKNEN